ncbi:hypothetical protein [Enterococcus casseliflavus]|uniref:hypothetical protein n=1 Tax=Enterococcus casseliflavus TaxID=37734 RepID=UPI0035DF290B
MKSKYRILDLLMCLSLIACVLTNFGEYSIFNFTLIITVIITLLFNIKEMHEINRKLFVIILAILTIFLLSVIQQNSSDLFKFIVWIFEGIIGYYFIKRKLLAREHDYKSSLAFVFLFVLFLSSIEGTIQFFSGEITFINYLNYWGDGLHQGTVSIFLQHIVWGHVLVLGFVVNEFFNKGNIKNVLRVLFLANLYWSQARSAWLTLVIFLALNFLYKLKKQNYKIKLTKLRVLNFIIVLCLLTCFILFMPSLNQRVYSLIDSIFSHFFYLFKGEANYRLRAIQALLFDRLENINLVHWLFGSGYGSTSVALAKNGISLSGFRYVVDNQIISLGYDFGLIAFVFIFYLFFDSLKEFVTSENKLSRIISSLFICNFIMSLVYESFGYQVTALIFFFLIGAKLSLITNRKML